MGRPSWIPQVGPKCKHTSVLIRGRFDYTRQGQVCRWKHQVGWCTLKVQRRTASQGTLTATRSFEKTRKRILPHILRRSRPSQHLDFPKPSGAAFGILISTTVNEYICTVLANKQTRTGQVNATYTGVHADKVKSSRLMTCKHYWFPLAKSLPDQANGQ